MMERRWRSLPRSRHFAGAVSVRPIPARSSALPEKTPLLILAHAALTPEEQAANVRLNVDVRRRSRILK